MPDSDNKGRGGLALAIPVAANIGGIGSPIGTPPNVVAVGWLEKIRVVVIGFSIADLYILMALLFYYSLISILAPSTRRASPSTTISSPE